MNEQSQHSLKKQSRCWDGYKPVPGKKPFTKGSCEPVKEQEAEKKGYTNIPLSPEESYLASQLLGKSLFSAIQLAKEKEYQQNLLSNEAMQADGGNVLRIPIPKKLLPNPEGQKQASYAPSPEAMAAMQDLLAYNNYVRKHGNPDTYDEKAQSGIAPFLDSVSASQDKLHRSGNAGIMSILPFGKAHKQRKQYDQDIDWINSELRKSANDPSDALHMNHEPGVIARALKLNTHPVKKLMGMQSGFRDAKKEFYLQEKANIAEELMNAQKDYVTLLERIKTGEEKEGRTSSTPCVDAFCNGIAYGAIFEKAADEKGLPSIPKEIVELFSKVAGAENVDISDGSVGRLLKDTFGVVKKPFQPAVDTAASGLLATSAGTAYLTYLLRKRMREEPEKYMQEKLPTRVELQPYE
jgi:hypothetical protein